MPLLLVSLVLPLLLVLQLQLILLLLLLLPSTLLSPLLLFILVTLLTTQLTTHNKSTVYIFDFHYFLNKEHSSGITLLAEVVSYFLGNGNAFLTPEEETSARTGEFICFMLACICHLELEMELDQSITCTI